MREGKKVAARNVMRAAFAHIKRTQIEKYNTAKTDKERLEIELDPVLILHRAIENTTPVLELVKLRRGGVHYQVPHPLTWKRARFLSMNWLIEAAKNKERTIHLGTTLGNELMNAAANTVYGNLVIWLFLYNLILYLIFILLFFSFSGFRCEEKTRITQAVRSQSRLRPFQVAIKRND